MTDTNLRDKMWMWGHEAGAHNGYYNLPAPSRITPVEAAVYMGLDNLIMVGIGDKPEPPFDRHMIAMRPMKRVVWSVVGDSSSKRTSLEDVLDLVPKFPNLCGGIMDDFFGAGADGVPAREGVESLRAFQARLKGGVRPLDLYVTLYGHDLDLPIAGHTSECDVITFWSWQSKDLVDLPRNMDRVKALAPDKRILLGLYMYDYGAEASMPLERMQYQAELGLTWLKEGRIDGLIFLASCACDLELDTVAWAKEWIAAL